MKKTFIAAATVAAFTFAACSDSKTENAETTAEQTETMDQEQTTTAVAVETPDYSAVAEPFKTQVTQLVNQYMTLTDALVASDAAAAQAAANNVLTIAKAMPVATLTTDEKAYAEEQNAAVINSATSIAGTTDLAVQRENLEKLSEAVFSMAKAFDAAEGTLYYQHCPMAFNNKGAYWLSASKDIRNPYFGDAMLSCGSTEEIFKK